MLARILLSLVLCGLLGCGSHSRAPVEDRTAQSSSGSYTVIRGDTLYSIAFRAGMDFRKVAAANGISPPYTIYPGQVIYLSEAVATTPISVAPAPSESGSYLTRRPAPAPTPVPVPVPVPAYGSSTTHVPAPHANTQDSPALEPPITTPTQPITGAPVPALIPAPAPEIVPRSAEPDLAVKPVPPPTPSPESTPLVGDKVDIWLWPTVGQVTRDYSESVHKGIDIGGARGDPIIAVAAGKVVYAGTGIVGFGELLIVKHNDVYLSAYGHNDRLLVAEGQTVTAGQTIAEKGSSGTDTVKLHFEIRKEGKPIDPQRVLPQR